MNFVFCNNSERKIEKVLTIIIFKVSFNELNHEKKKKQRIKKRKGSMGEGNKNQAFLRTVE